MGPLLQVLGLVLVVVWAGCVFGWPASLLAAGVALILLGVAFADAPRPRLRRRGSS